MQNQHYIVAVVHETSGHIAIFRVLNSETAEYMRDSIEGWGKPHLHVVICYDGPDAQTKKTC